MAKSFACVTSMNQHYYDQCGRACIETYGRYWPQDIPLYVYNEDMSNPPKNKWTRFIPWSVMPSEYHAFAARNKQFGRTVQFGKKAFSIIHALHTIDCDRLIWLDADVMSISAVNEQLLDLITPDRVVSTHYGVRHAWPSTSDSDRTSFSCETGFFVVNRRHPEFRSFLLRYLEYYERDLGQDLRRYYDGEVYGAVVAEFQERRVGMMDLNPDHKHKTPIPRSVMAPYIMHYKAGAKDPFTSADLLRKHLSDHDHGSDLS